MEVLRCQACRKPLMAGSLFCNWCGVQQGVKPPEKRRRKTTTRAYGTGTIRKLPNRRKPFAAYLPHSMGEKYIGSFTTYSEASAALSAEIAQRPSSQRAEWTVGDFYNYYIASSDFAKLTKSAQNTAFAAWKYCQSAAGVRMRDAKAHTWQACVDSAVEQGRSRSTCEKIRNLASQLCKEAMKDDVINKNYASLVSVSDGADKKVKDVFTQAEIDVLRAHDEDPRVKFILILIYTGMRINELLELPCDSVHEAYIVGGKKTTAGKNRIIPILPEISPHIDFFNRGDGLLIHNDEKPVSEKFARNKWFYGALVELGILSADEIPPNGTPRLTPHCTRHTFATLARQAGIKPDVLTRIIGHTDYSMTDEVYIDMQADFLLAEMRKMSSDSDGVPSA